MPKKSLPGGSTVESVSTKQPKSTTKKVTSKRTSKAAKESALDKAYYDAVDLWNQVKESVYQDTIHSRGSAGTIRAANPRSPEDKAWWDKNGVEMVANYIRFREYGGWQVAMINGEPAVEIELQVPVGDTFIKMAIDRVMVDPQGNYCIVDLKTGRRVPESTLQLGFYRYGLKKVYGIDINIGYYWMARQSTMTDAIDLSDYTEKKIEYLVTAFDNARKAHSFIPNTSNCKMCGYTMHCIWYKGEKK